MTLAGLEQLRTNYIAESNTDFEAEADRVRNAMKAGEEEEKEGNGMAKKLEDVGPERIADYFVSYLFTKYPGNNHVRRVASWVGLIVLGIDKLADRRYIPRNRQLRFEYDGRSFKAKFNHRSGPRGGIDIVEIVEGRGSPEGETICSIKNLQEAAAFYDDPAEAF